MQFAREVPQNVKMSNWPELAVHKVWRHAVRLPGITERLPDEWDGGRRTDKAFFWSTVIGQHPDWVQRLVNDCTKKRRARATAKQLPRATIAIPENIARMLMGEEFQIRGKSSVAAVLTSSI